MLGEHAYTLHHTYTGRGCAMCGLNAETHKADHWLVDGERIRICPYCHTRPVDAGGMRCTECDDMLVNCDLGDAA